MVALSAVLANTGRLGDTCGGAADCNSGCCWYGVCRSGLADCSPKAQLTTFTDYQAAEKDLMVNTFIGKILLLADRSLTNT